MVLFDYLGGEVSVKVKDVVNVVIDLQKVFKIYNFYCVKVGYVGIGVGVGIYFGLVILGIVGFDDCMDIMVIGDSVNVVFRLEGLVFKYYVDIVVSV